MRTGIGSTEGAWRQSGAPRRLRLPAETLDGGGSSVGQSRGLIILRSQVQVLPAPPELDTPHRNCVWFHLTRDFLAPADGLRGFA